MLKLNVGGKETATLKSTLLQMEYFKSSLARWTEEDNPCVFVDDNPKIFSYILDAIRYQSLVTVPRVWRELVLNRLDYYGYQHDFSFKPTQTSVTCCEIRVPNSIFLANVEKIIALDTHDVPGQIDLVLESPEKVTHYTLDVKHYDTTLLANMPTGLTSAQISWWPKRRDKDLGLDLVYEASIKKN